MITNPSSGVVVHSGVTIDVVIFGNFLISLLGRVPFLTHTCFSEAIHPRYGPDRKFVKNALLTFFVWYISAKFSPDLVSIEHDFQFSLDSPRDICIQNYTHVES